MTNKYFCGATMFPVSTLYRDMADSDAVIVASVIKMGKRYRTQERRMMYRKRNDAGTRLITMIMVGK